MDPEHATEHQCRWQVARRHEAVLVRVTAGPKASILPGEGSVASKQSPRAKKAPAKKSARRSALPREKAPAHPVRRVATGDAPLVKRLRKICLGFPEAGERLSHGEPTWFAGKGKVFAMLDNHHHGSPHLSVWLPQPIGAQETLIEVDPDRFFRPPYVGPSGWVGVVLDTKPDWRMVESLVRESFVHVATKRLVAQLTASAVGRS